MYLPTVESKNIHLKRNIAPMPMRHLARTLFMAGGMVAEYDSRDGYK